MLLRVAKWLAHDPNRTRTVGRRAGIAIAFLAVLMFGISVGGNLGRGTAAPEPLPPVAVPQTEPPGSPLSPATTGPRTTAPDPTIAADTVTLAFLNAWLQAPVYESSKRGHAAWLAACSPFVDGATYGLLQLADKGKVPTAADGKPLRVVRVRGVDQTGDVATLQGTLSNGATVTVTATGQQSGWRVSGYRVA